MIAEGFCQYCGSTKGLACDCQKEKVQSALSIQIGGDHYKTMPIQVVEFCMANKVPYMEGNVIKYVSRWRIKGNGIEDLKKAKHYLELLIEKEETNNEHKGCTDIQDNGTKEETWSHQKLS